MVAPAKRAAGGGVQAELCRARDGVASRIAPLVRRGGLVGGGIQMESARRVIGICAGIVGADAAGHARAVNRQERDGSKRQARTEIELCDDGPLAEKRPRAAAGEKPARSRSGGVLSLEGRHVA